MKTKTPRISVSIVTFNEEDRIGKTLESVQDLAWEIIIVDSYSADNTAEIARTFGAEVFTEEWKGFAAQKNSALAKCSGDWILFLDADEEVTPELKEEILKIAESPEAVEAYFINRRTEYLGKLLKRSWQPDLRLRLAKSTAMPSWEGEFVHEELKTRGRKGRLKGEIIHRSYRNIEDHMIKTVRYARLSAKSYYASGRKPSLIKLIFTPLFSFFKLYILKLGFADGVRGFIAAESACVYSFLKYAFLWNEYRKAENKKNHEK